MFTLGAPFVFPRSSKRAAYGSMRLIDCVMIAGVSLGHRRVSSGVEFVLRLISLVLRVRHFVVGEKAPASWRGLPTNSTHYSRAYPIFVAKPPCVTFFSLSLTGGSRSLCHAR